MRAGLLASLLILSVVALVLADRGLLDVDAPVAAYWPDFAVGGPGKADASVRSILEHSLGLLSCANGYLWQENATIRDILVPSRQDFQGEYILFTRSIHLQRPVTFP